MLLEALEGHDEILLTVVVGIAGTTIGVGARNLYGKAMRFLSGASVISDNARNILGAAKDYASQMGMDIKQIEEAPVDLANVKSLFVANADWAAITLVTESGPNRQAVRLDKIGGFGKLGRAQSVIDNPEAVHSIFSTQSETMAAEHNDLRQQDWVRPSASGKVLAGFIGDDGFEARATDIRDALDYTVRVLAASPQQNINLCGPCHIALKITEEGGKAMIVVMPTTKREADLIIGIENGSHALPGNEMSPKAILDALVKLNQPLAETNGVKSV